MLIICIVFLPKVCVFFERDVIYKKQPKIVVAQIGLYYEKGGATSRFLADLHEFVKKNNGVDFVVFSENSLYGFKRDYNRTLTEQLLKDVKKINIMKSMPFCLTFMAFAI